MGLVNCDHHGTMVVSILNNVSVQYVWAVVVVSFVTGFSYYPCKYIDLGMCVCKGALLLSTRREYRPLGSERVGIPRIWCCVIVLASPTVACPDSVV